MPDKFVEKCIRDARYIDGLLQDIDEVRDHEVQTELHEWVHLQEVWANEDRNGIVELEARVVIVRPVWILQQPLKDRYVTMHG
jgi:hypothetical protein